MSKSRRGAYYNEHDPFAAAWLRELIAAGHLPPGDVDERDIQDVDAGDVKGYAQCHWFAGIGGWAYALRLAGWEDDRQVWTGSCPCQPFSTAGKRGGSGDERHLWPAWFSLIRECRPAIVFGEQVASSLVIGSGTEVDDLYQVLGRKAIFDVLLQSEGILSECLPELRECPSQQTQTCELCGRSLTGARENACIGSSIPSEQIQPSIQSGSGGYSSENFGGLLRTNGDRIRSENPEGMEFSIAGSNKARSGIHKGKRKGRALCPECHGTQLGAFIDPEDSGCDSGSYQDCIGRLVKETGRSFEKEPSTWLSSVQSDLEGIGYSFGASVLTAAGVGAPHRRQRLYFVAHSAQQCNNGNGHTGTGWRFESANRSGDGRVDNSSSPRRDPTREWPESETRNETRMRGLERGREEHGGVADPTQCGQQQRDLGNETSTQHPALGRGPERYEGSRRDDASDGGVANFWSSALWLPCRDSKLRPVEPTIFPLAHGFWYRMVHVFAAFVEWAAKEVVNHAKATRTSPSEVMRVVRQKIGESPLREWSPRRQDSISQAAFLFNFMRDIEAMVGGASISGSIPQASFQEIQGRVLRDLRDNAAVECSSLRRKPNEQLPEQSSDTMLELSQLLARCCESAWNHSTGTDASDIPMNISRVGLLRGAGNAIVPQVAAEFIRAYREGTGG